MSNQNLTGTNCLNQFLFHQNNSYDKFESQAFGCTNNVDVVCSPEILEIECLFLKKLTFMDIPLKILRVFQKPMRNVGIMQGLF